MSQWEMPRQEFLIVLLGFNNVIVAQGMICECAHFHLYYGFGVYDFTVKL